MSMFGSLMGDFEEDTIFGSHMRSMRQMNNMMNSMFNDPFGMMGQNAITDGHHRPSVPHNELQMMPFGFPTMPAFNMQRIYTDFDNMAAGGNCHSFTSRSFVTMTNGPDGRPQVYKETMSTKTAPGGIKETKKTVSDSQSGTKKLSIGHHIGERAHILEREQNYHSGEHEEHQEFINLEEDEAETFNHEWETHARRPVGAIGASNYGATGGHSRSRPEHRQLALPDPSASRHSSSSSRWAPSARRSIRPVSTSKLRNTTSGISSNTSGLPKAATTTSVTPAIAAAAPAPAVTATVTATSPSTSGSTSASSTKGTRKRQHTSDVKESKKRPAV